MCSSSHPEFRKINNKCKTAFDIFKDYYSRNGDAIRRKLCEVPLQSKDNNKSFQYRMLGYDDYAQYKFNVCLDKFTRGLTNATCNGTAYADALDNRSSTHLRLRDYKSCIVDIDLCLQADYPVPKRPNLLIRKAKCFHMMKNYKEALETIEYCTIYMRDHLDMPENYFIDQDIIKENINIMLNNLQCNTQEPVVEKMAPTIETIEEENILNPHISAAIKLKYNEETGMEYLADRDIKCGEVLFVTEAYASSCTQKLNESTYVRHGICSCDYCYMETKNAIPCKHCPSIKILYCSENCRDKAWDEFHQWECDIIRSQLLGKSVAIFLSLRTVIKAASSGVIFQIRNDSKYFSPTKDMDPYLNIYNMYIDFRDLRSNYMDQLEKMCKETVVMIEYLKKTTFFDHLILNESCNRNYEDLVLFVGGLLLKHYAQSLQKGLDMWYPALTTTIDEEFRKLKYYCDSNYCRYALCPNVSDLQYSCESNTCFYFNKKTCVVRARTDIKAGCKITRFIFKINYSILLGQHKNELRKLTINCACNICTDKNYNIDILERIYCPDCNEYTVSPSSTTTVIAKTCHCPLSNENFSAIEKYQEAFSIFRDEGTARTLSTVKECLESFKELLHPHSTLTYQAYHKLALLYVLEVSGDLENFNESLNKFKELKEIKKKFNTMEYAKSLIGVCRAYYLFIQRYKNTMQQNNIVEMITNFENAAQESKAIIAVEYPPMLNILHPIEMYLRKLRIKYILLQDIH